MTPDEIIEKIEANGFTVEEIRPVEPGGKWVVWILLHDMPRFIPGSPAGPNPKSESMFSFTDSTIDGALVKALGFSETFRQWAIAMFTDSFAWTQWNLAVFPFIFVRSLANE